MAGICKEQCISVCKFSRRSHSKIHDDFDLAHLDIRLDNIYGDRNSNEFQAILIDLDRSQPKSVKHARSRLEIYKSEMYRVPDRSWTLDKVDWRQMGIMVFAILNGISGADYHDTLPLPNSVSLQALIDEGEFNTSLFQGWSPESDVV